MLRDEKNDLHGVQMVLLEGIGKPVVKHVDKSTLVESFTTLQTYFKK